MSGLKFPLILAGPIVRRVEPARVFIWIATSRRSVIDADFYKITKQSADPEIVFDYEEMESLCNPKTVRVGRRLFIHLVEVSPVNGQFPTNTLIGYNLHFRRDSMHEDLNSLGFLTPEHPKSIVYGKLHYPTFQIKSGEAPSHIFYGSCRKLHGEGEDTLARADTILEKNYHNIHDRPDSLFLMGDQIYADDVASAMIRTISTLGQRLIGQKEPLNKIDNRLEQKPYSSSLNQIDGRQNIIKQLAKFTTSHPENHLIELGEYAAMYLLSWNPEVWLPIQSQLEENLYLEKEYPSSSPFSDETHITMRLNSNHSSEEQKAITTFHGSLCRVRRLLANIPTYMIFDDHDITDDWNISASWKKNVQNAPLGRHIIANGLSAYWLFQGWGNDPDAFDHDFIKKMNSYFKILKYGIYHSRKHEKWENALWKFTSWPFIAPTEPKAVFLDTRTQREYEPEPTEKKWRKLLTNKDGVPQLVSKKGWAVVTKKLQASGWKSGNPLMVVSATPVYGMGLIESFLQDFVYPFRLLGAKVETSFDYEAWKYNGKGFTELLNQVSAWNPFPCIILSGDVHFASAVKSTVTFANNKQLAIEQYTSSPLKNMSFSGVWGLLMKKVIDANSLSRRDQDIHRVCDPSYTITHVEKENDHKPYLWSDQLRYQFVVNNSIVETNNNLGLLSIKPNHITNQLLK